MPTAPPEAQNPNWWDQPAVAQFLGGIGGGQQPGLVGQPGAQLPVVQPVYAPGVNPKDPQSALAAQQTADQRTAALAQLGQQYGPRDPRDASNVSGFVEHYDPYGGSNSS